MKKEGASRPFFPDETVAVGSDEWSALLARHSAVNRAPIQRPARVLNKCRSTEGCVLMSGILFSLGWLACLPIGLAAMESETDDDLAYH